MNLLVYVYVRVGSYSSVTVGEKFNHAFDVLQLLIGR